MLAGIRADTRNGIVHAPFSAVSDREEYLDCELVTIHQLPTEGHQPLMESDPSTAGDLLYTHCVMGDPPPLVDLTHLEWSDISRGNIQGSPDGRAGMKRAAE